MPRHILKGAILSAVLLSTVSCDTGLGLITTKIAGKVIFIHPENRPNSVESVWVIAAEKSLFENPSLSDVVISDRPVNLFSDSSAYEVFVPHGSYVIVAAIWKEKGKDWNYLNILGIYGFDPTTFTYYDTNPIAINQNRPVATDYNIICDWGFIFSQKGSD